MNLTVQPIGRDDALEILSWKYDEPYDFYNMDDDGIGELLNGTYFTVFENGVLIGYCCFGNSAIVPTGIKHGAYPDNGALDIGLGMRPDMTGHGRGYAFVRSILEFAQSEFNATPSRLTVAQFNKRAIALYHKLGFEPIMMFLVGDVEFLTMERKTA